MGLLTVNLSTTERVEKFAAGQERTGIEFPRYFTAKLERGRHRTTRSNGRRGPRPSEMTKAR